MAIVIEENPLTAALAQGISSIPQFMQAGQERQLAERQQQLREQELAIAQSQHQQNTAQKALELQMLMKSQGMDAHGYDNPMLNSYFLNLATAKGTFEPDSDNASGWSWTGDDAHFPTMNEAWQAYKSFTGGQHNESDWLNFQKRWDEVVKMRNARYSNEISKLTNMGNSEEDIRWILANNQAADKSVQNLIGSLSPEEQAKYKQYLPQKQESLTEVLSDKGHYMAGVGLAGYQGFNWLASTPQDVIDAAKDKFSTAKTEARSKERKVKLSKKSKQSYKLSLEQAEERLEKAKKWGKKGSKGRKTRVSNAKSLLQKVKNSVNADIRKARSAKDLAIDEGKRFKKWKLNHPFSTTMMADMAPNILGAGGEALWGRRGEGIGRMGGGVIEGGAAVARGMSLNKWLQNYAKKQAIKRAPKAAGMALADTAAPIGDVLGMLYLGGGAIADLREGYKIWKEANRRAGK